MADNLKGSYNKDVKVGHMVSGNEPLSYSVTFKIKMETKMGESMAVVGSLNELGRWKNFNQAKMKWTTGHIWVITLEIPKTNTVFMYKYVKVVNGNADSWEQGYNRIADLLSLHQVQNGTSEEPIKVSEVTLNDIWESYTVNFSIYYPIEEDEKMRINGEGK